MDLRCHPHLKGTEMNLGNRFFSAFPVGIKNHPSGPVGLFCRVLFLIQNIKADMVRMIIPLPPAQFQAE